MGEEMQFPLFTNCKMTISSKVSMKSGNLLKLITDELHFKIVGCDPLIIEKDCPSQQDMFQLFDALKAFVDMQESRHQTVKQEEHSCTNDVTHDNRVLQVGQTGKKINSNKTLTEEGAHQRAGRSQSQPRINTVDEHPKLPAERRLSAEGQILKQATNIEEQTQNIQDREREKLHTENTDAHNQRVNLSHEENYNERMLTNFSHHTVFSKEASIEVKKHEIEDPIEVLDGKDYEEENGSRKFHKDMESSFQLEGQDSCSSLHGTNQRESFNIQDNIIGDGPCVHDIEHGNGSSLHRNISTVPQSACDPTEDHHSECGSSKNEIKEREDKKIHESASWQNQIGNPVCNENSLLQPRIMFDGTKHVTQRMREIQVLEHKNNSQSKLQDFHHTGYSYQVMTSRAPTVKQEELQLKFDDTCVSSKSEVTDASEECHWLEKASGKTQTEEIQLEHRRQDQNGQNSENEEFPHFRNGSKLDGNNVDSLVVEGVSRLKQDESTCETHRQVSRQSPSPQHRYSDKKHNENSEHNKDVNCSSLPKRRHEPEPNNSSLTPSHISRCDASSDYQNSYCIVSDKSNLKVQVYKANITELEVDCIVNAANKWLQHWGGVAKAISEAAGPALGQECESYTKAGKIVEVTNVFVSTGGKLPAKYVMHAVGPMWDDYDEEKKFQCFDDLRHTVLRCLVEASRRKLISIALPSISAAIFGVPKDQCARCYLEAVKHYDIFSAGQGSTLKEIHFVDVDDTMVNCITECFSKNWSKLSDLEIVQKDGDFAKTHIYSTFRIETANYHRISGPENTPSDRVESVLPARQTEDLAGASALVTSRQSEMNAAYQFGKITLHVDSRHALDPASDIIITIGKAFDKLSGIPDFRILPNLKQCEDKHSRKDIFEFFNISDANGKQSLLCEVYPEPDSVDKVMEAFKNLEAAIQRCETHGNHVDSSKELVLTSSVLYAEPANKQQQKGNKISLDGKKVGRFAHCLCDYLDKISKEPKENLSITVVGSEDAMPTIEKVIESRDVRKIGPREIVTTMDLEKVCGFCCEDKPCRSVTCCKKLLCKDCEQGTSVCPFCNKFWWIITGDQPPGFMTVTQISDHVDGYEDVNTWEIEYYFPTGKQKEYHPSPGKKYDSVKRTAFLPANELGSQLLVRLRLAFIRNLTFTIGKSMSRQKDNVIIWNDISHKTKLNGGKYGYPDPNYLQQVSLELATKGVKLNETLTDSERRELANFSRRIHNFKKFSDLDSDLL